jgi:hypothetical protein
MLNEYIRVLEVLFIINKVILMDDVIIDVFYSTSGYYY